MTPPKELQDKTLTLRDVLLIGTVLCSIAGFALAGGMKLGSIDTRLGNIEKTLAAVVQPRIVNPASAVAHAPAPAQLPGGLLACLPPGVRR